MVIDLITFLAAVFVFGLLIISHEIGHFVTAKSFGVGVVEFSVGMGPKLLGFKRNGTDYSLRLIPLGGYVRMLGEDENSADPKAFCNQNPWKKLIIMVAGAFMNFVVAIVLLAIVFYNTGVYNKAIVGSLENGYPAVKAGIQLNDKIISINDRKITKWDEFTEYVTNNKDKEMSMGIERNGKILKINVKPEYVASEKRYMVGISPYIIKGNIGVAFSESFSRTGDLVKLIMQFFGRLFTGKFSSNDVGGPVAIIQMSGQAAKLGIWTLLMFTAYLSINLGIINMVPFPALDGGWVLILLIEGITGKKIDDNKIGIINLIGFAFLIGLSILVTYKDILRLNIK